MFKPSFTEQSKRAKPSSQLEAMFKINEGLRLLQMGQQPDQNSSSGTVAEQIQQQGIAALNQPQESPEMLSEGPPEGFQGSSEAIQNTVNTPMGQVAMQANIAEQMKAAQQQQMQQQLMQMASQQPQQMAQGGIAALSANNMRNFQRGGVVGFNGQEGSSVPGSVEAALARVADAERALQKYGLRQRSENPEGFQSALAAVRDARTELNAVPTGVPDTPVFRYASPTTRAPAAKIQNTPEEVFSLLEAAASKNINIPQPPVPTPAANPAPAAAQAIPRPQAMPRQQAMQPPERAGLGSLMPALGKVDLSAFEADKQASLENVNKQVLPQMQTPRQIGERNEAEAKAMGIDLYGTETKARLAAEEQEFANLSAARAEANKSRGMDNLITMLTNSGGAPTLFAGLAKGTQAYQAAEKLQKADDLIWGGKKLDFMRDINKQKELLNERNKAMMLGNIAESRKLDEEIRVGQNSIYKQVAEVHLNSADKKAQAAISSATNAVNLAIQQMRQRSEDANRAAAREGSSFAAIQSRITQNAQTSSNIITAMEKNFDLEHQKTKVLVSAGVKLSGDAQKEWETAKANHQKAIKQEIMRAADENYKLELFQWQNGGKANGLPAPTKPFEGAGSSKGNIPGYFVVPQ